MADILFRCPDCGKSLAVLSAYAGQKTSCPDCKKGVTIPEPDFAFECPHCKTELQAADAYSGQKVSCPECSKEVVIPLEAAPDQATDGPPQKQHWMVSGAQD